MEEMPRRDRWSDGRATGLLEGGRPLFERFSGPSDPSDVK